MRRLATGMPVVIPGLLVFEEDKPSSRYIRISGPDPHTRFQLLCEIQRYVRVMAADISTRREVPCALGDLVIEILDPE